SLSPPSLPSFPPSFSPLRVPTLVMSMLAGIDSTTPEVAQHFVALIMDNEPDPKPADSEQRPPINGQAAAAAHFLCQNAAAERVPEIVINMAGNDDVEKAAAGAAAAAGGAPPPAAPGAALARRQPRPRIKVTKKLPTSLPGRAWAQIKRPWKCFKKFSYWIMDGDGHWWNRWFDKWFKRTPLMYEDAFDSVMRAKTGIWRKECAGIPKIGRLSNDTKRRRTRSDPKPAAASDPEAPKIDTAGDPVVPKVDADPEAPEPAGASDPVVPRPASDPGAPDIDPAEASLARQNPLPGFPLDKIRQVSIEYTGMQMEICAAECARWSQCKKERAKEREAEGMEREKERLDMRKRTTAITEWLVDKRKEEREKTVVEYNKEKGGEVKVKKDGKKRKGRGTDDETERLLVDEDVERGESGGGGVPAEQVDEDRNHQGRSSGDEQGNKEDAIPAVGPEESAVRKEEKTKEKKEDEESRKKFLRKKLGKALLAKEEKKEEKEKEKENPAAMSPLLIQIVDEINNSNGGVDTRSIGSSKSSMMSPR
ncbi:hypothetical protein PFISCL1PPCAC_12888, partial [Pristionchus fissidentatus]